jgi:hypothetical protein
MSDSIRTRLEREEREALEQFRAAHNRLNEILKDVPSGIPHPDGSVRIQHAGAAVRFHSRKVADATRRLLDYLTKGIIPDEP